MLSPSLKQQQAIPSNQFADPTHRWLPIRTQAELNAAYRVLSKPGTPDAVKEQAIALATSHHLALPPAWQNHQMAQGRAQMAGALATVTDSAFTGDQSGVSDSHRDALQAALLAALLLVYLGRTSEARAALSQSGLFSMSSDALATLHAFVADRAQLIQAGINARIAQLKTALSSGSTTAERAAATNSLPKPVRDALSGLEGAATSEERATAHDALKQSIHDYHAGTLGPFMDSTTVHAALIDTYQSVESATPGVSMADSVLWEWVRNTEWKHDGCQEAEDASPAPLDTLIGLAGSAPSVHLGCDCDLHPA